MTQAIYSKPIQNMIENNQAAYWIYFSDLKEFRLFAITYICENGNRRIKLVWKTMFLNDGLKMHQYLMKNHDRYDGESFQESMEKHYYKTGEKLDGLFTRDWEKNILEEKSL